MQVMWQLGMEKALVHIRDAVKCLIIRVGVKTHADCMRAQVTRQLEMQKAAL